MIFIYTFFSTAFSFVSSNPISVEVEESKPGPGMEKKAEKPLLLTDEIGKKTYPNLIVAVGNEIVEFPATFNRTGTLELEPLLDDHSPWSFSDDDFESDSMQDVISSRKRSSDVPGVTATTLTLKNHEEDDLVNPSSKKLQKA